MPPAELELELELLDVGGGGGGGLMLLLELVMTTPLRTVEVDVAEDEDVRGGDDSAMMSRALS